MGSANFGNAFDLSTLKKPTGEVVRPTHGKAVTQENLVSDFVTKSKECVVILLAWSARSAQAKEILERLGKLEIADKNAWLLGVVDVDAQPQVAQALQIKSVPVAIAIIGEQLLPLFESVPPADQGMTVAGRHVGGRHGHVEGFAGDAFGHRRGFHGAEPLAQQPLHLLLESLFGWRIFRCFFFALEP